MIPPPAISRAAIQSGMACRQATRLIGPRLLLIGTELQIFSSVVKFCNPSQNHIIQDEVPVYGRKDMKIYTETQKHSSSWAVG
ncbi:hypothetical protein RRG08_011924 [Elysia crispata]|uniref:Uncharacterized protein n=1 Tax=Elysia crispata TaxID=231223 RepID=A0AAE0Y7W5_9GAST|nr:hypothetical protein RRG08_011924 [Elysia crispata]